MSNVKQTGRSTAAAAGSRLARGAEPAKTVSGRWILTASVVAVATALLCVWSAFCFLFWQGSWQLLYHPKAQIAQRPSGLELPFDSVDFAVTEAGQPQLHGWWIAAAPDSRFAAIYLHGADGNIGDAVDEIALLHAAQMNVLAFDYRGYGESQFARPSEEHWRQDAESAIQFLTNTRHITAGSIVLVGRGLGANLALETAAAHPELTGVVAEDPIGSPEQVIFGDPRARLVPAHWLVSDRWDVAAAAKGLRIPSLWFFSASPAKAQSTSANAYDAAQGRKLRVWLTDSPARSTDYETGLSRWLGDLSAAQKTH